MGILFSAQSQIWRDPVLTDWHPYWEVSVCIDGSGIAKVDGREVHYDISFGGSFFALVDIEQFGWHVDPQSIPQLTDFGMKLIEKVKRICRSFLSDRQFVIAYNAVCLSARTAR